MKSLLLLLLVLLLTTTTLACTPGQPALVSAMHSAEHFLMVAQMERGPAHEELLVTIKDVREKHDLCWRPDHTHEMLIIEDPVVADAMARARHHLLLVEVDKMLASIDEPPVVVKDEL